MACPAGRSNIPKLSSTMANAPKHCQSGITRVRGCTCKLKQSYHQIHITAAAVLQPNAVILGGENDLNLGPPCALAQQSLSLLGRQQHLRWIRPRGCACSTHGPGEDELSAFWL